VRPAVVSDFVPARDHIGAFARPGFYSETGDEPCRPDPARSKEIQNTAGYHRSELATRERRRSRHASRDKARLGVKIKSKANDVARHVSSSASLAFAVGGGRA